MPSMVIVPARSANWSVVVVLVVQLPDLVVERVVDVEIGPVGLSLADTVTILEEQCCLLQLSREMSVGATVTDRSAPTDIEPLEAHPNSSEITEERPLLETEYLKISRHGGPSDPSSFEETKRFVSVHTSRPPLVAQVDELLEKLVPLGEVSAATGPIARSRMKGTARNATPIRRTGHLLTT
jgi:hypothetical protein